VSDHNKNKKNMKKIIKLSSIRFMLAAASGLAAVFSSHAQNTLTAVATLSDVQAGSTFDYTLTLQNTGSVAINSFWYGWIQGVFNLPTAGSSLQNVQNSLGWNAINDGNSIQFENNSGTALAAGNSITFTFDSTATPNSFITDTSSRPVQSIAYSTANGPSTFGQSENGIASDPIATTLIATPTPEPSALALLATGGFGLALIYSQKLRKSALVAKAVKN
jgi:PEP-CTERM motif